MSEEIYKKLKQLRKERGLTLNTLAEKIGSDYQQISRIERGKSRLTLDVLMKMAEALETPISDIVKAEGSEGKRAFSQNSVVASPPSLLDHTFTQEFLGIILEKIETLFQHTQSHLGPQMKALLASQVYSQVSLEYQNGKNLLAIHQLIDFSIGLLKTILLNANR